MNNVKSLPKRKLISFLSNAEMDVDYEFIVDIPNSNALVFVHRMRVELSRLRTKVIQRDRIPKSFKMLFIKSEAMGTLKCKITLKKSQSRNDVSGEIDEIFDVIAGGQKLDV